MCDSSSSSNIKYELVINKWLMKKKPKPKPKQIK